MSLVFQNVVTTATTKEEKQKESGKIDFMILYNLIKQIVFWIFSTLDKLFLLSIHPVPKKYHQNGTNIPAFCKVVFACTVYINCRSAWIMIVILWNSFVQLNPSEIGSIKW